MDISPTSKVKSDQMVCGSDDDLQGSSHVRSYTCAFCKRGFSNAQALGGHMNIHRRDRAKLKQAFDENFLSLDIAKSTEEITSAPKTPCAPSSEDEGATPINKASEKTQQPALFVDPKLGTDHGNEDNKMMQLQEGLDLELRLGSEPHESSTRTSTREFF